MSPLYEFEPHATYFDKPVKLEMSLKNSPENLCLYKQGNEESDRILNKWSVHFPIQKENDKFEFELESFSFGFLGKMDAGLDMSGEEVSNEEFKRKFKEYQYIYPGLNYRVKCEDVMCDGNKELMMIAKRGYGNFQPNIDLDKGELYCLICNKPIEQASFIESLILFQTKGIIQFKLNKKGAKLETIPFDIKGNELMMLGDKNETKAYSTLKIVANKSVNNFDEKIRVGVTDAMIRNKVYSRTIVLMDATASMGNLLEKAKTTVHTMFQQAVEILKQQNVDEDCFEMQFACYRDYDSGLDKILEVSSWEKNPEKLKQFMETIDPLGGEDQEEAIEIGFLHVNQENAKFKLRNEKISQVILIADAAAKEREAISEYRDKFGGEDVWKQKFGNQTYYIDELIKLKNDGVTVFAFYLNDLAKENFEKIASISGTSASCQLLDVKSAEGAKTLSRLVTTKILSEIGATIGMGNTLSNAYLTKFQ